MINTVNLNLNSLKFRNYVRKADPKINYWFSFYVGKMNNKITEFGNDFFIIIIRGIIVITNKLYLYLLLHYYFLTRKNE